MSRTASPKAYQGDSVASAPTPLAPGPAGGPPSLSNSTRNYSIHIWWPPISEVNIVHGHLSPRCSKITDFSSEMRPANSLQRWLHLTVQPCAASTCSTHFRITAWEDPSTSNGGASTQNLTLLLMLSTVLAATPQKQARALERSPEIRTRLDLGDRHQVADCQKPNKCVQALTCFGHNYQMRDEKAEALRRGAGASVNRPPKASPRAMEQGRPLGSGFCVRGFQCISDENI